MNAAGTPPDPARQTRRRLRSLGALAAVGAALVLMPFAFGMFDKTPKGAVMIEQFKPFMTTSRLDGYQSDLREINAGVHQSATSVAAYLDAHASDDKSFDASYPAFAGFERQWPGIDSKMTGLVDQVQGNLGNYLAVAALPSFTLFPWFFVIPGVIILGFALASLVWPRRWTSARCVFVVVGVGLIAAPGIFQMFQRAPAGGQMMTAFKTIETTENVRQIQGFFIDMAEGQGAIRLEIVPKLENSGLTSTQVASKFPAVATLDARWVHILNDMTPMIGAMSDNVANYQAIASLPPFPLFPWFFVLPGLLVVGLAIAGGSVRRREDGQEVAEGSRSVPNYQGVP